MKSSKTFFQHWDLLEKRISGLKYELWMALRGPLGHVRGLLRGLDEITYRLGGWRLPWGILGDITSLFILGLVLWSLIMEFNGVMNYGW